MGIAAAERLSQVWGGMSFTVPLNPGKTARALSLYENGVAKNRICRIVGISRPRLDRMIKAKENSSQLDLF